jgi:predicted nucleotidyltransferase component of viral defense system
MDYGNPGNSLRSSPDLDKKMIMALTLLENLRNSGLDFVFKGGTSLILLFKTPRRFSIDIDILLQDERGLITLLLLK